MASLAHRSGDINTQVSRRFASSRIKRFFVALSILLFLIPILWQANRVPRIGDIDTIRVGLVVINRIEPEAFSGDLAMQAGTWWPGYTPLYIAFLSAGYRFLGDFEILMFVLTALAYLSLLVGFYCLGRSLEFSWGLSLALALLSGLYIPTALGHSWTGIRLEMAAARNLYLALFPWVLCLGLCLYRLPKGHATHWMLFGLVVGLLANLHSINGITVVGTFLVMMLIGAWRCRFQWSYILAFTLGVLPGLAKIYLDTYVPYAEITAFVVDVIQGQASRLDTTIYGDTTYANLLFYRLPNWNLPIIIYTLLTAFTGVVFWRKRKPGWRMVFGLVQFYGAALLLTLDWLVLPVALEWGRRALRHEYSLSDEMALCFLFAVNILALTLGWIFAGSAVATDFSALLVPARSLLRGGAFVYAPLIVLGVACWGNLLRESWLRALIVILVIILGFHDIARIPPLNAIPISGTNGQFLPLDVWTYAGILLLVLYPRLQGRWRTLGWGWLAGLFFQACTRLLGAPAGDTITVLVAVIVGLSFGVAVHLNNQPRQQRWIAVVGCVVLAVLLFLPTGTSSAISNILTETTTALFRNWSRQDTGSLFYSDYYIGQWMNQNTPPGSLVVAGDTFMRYWMLRPIVIGTDDYLFFNHDPQQYNLLHAEAQLLQSAYQSPSTLLRYAREHKAAYLMILRQDESFSLDNAALVYQDSRFLVYALKQG